MWLKTFFSDSLLLTHVEDLFRDKWKNPCMRWSKLTHIDVKLFSKDDIFHSPREMRERERDIIYVYLCRLVGQSDSFRKIHLD